MSVRTAAALGALALLVFATDASAYDRRVRVVNETSQPINEFYASSVGQNTWEEDILGTDVLPAGQSLIINIDDGTGYCKYDFKAVLENGAEAVQGSVNVCEVETFSVYE